MGKRGDKGDPTMEVSTSQLVGGEPPRGDASVWKQVVVGTDQFAPSPNPQKPKSRRAVWLGLAAAVAVGGGAAVYVGISNGASPPPLAKPVAIDAAAAVPVVAPPIDATPSSPADAAATPADAPSPMDAAPGDAGSDVDAGVLHKHHPNKRHLKHHKAS